MEKGDNTTQNKQGNEEPQPEILLQLQQQVQPQPQPQPHELWQPQPRKPQPDPLLQLQQQIQDLQKKLEDMKRDRYITEQVQRSPLENLYQPDEPQSGQLNGCGSEDCGGNTIASDGR
ncbi:alpha/beta-gliadin MM1-like [Osmia bicornis bicornis]|uniref:alpha/beta-gliadin MM1-like n=1 Tax=Osmia bicornis bicornis TaxID=1437191 RepID=UPI001EAEFFE0|nr:alpha/beta-gliadin MM1-like [Osmia bicornis bicornis]